jgi:hypothetical protein
MSEVITEWCHEHSVIPIQPVYTSVQDMPPDNPETQRKQRLVCTLVGAVFNEETDGTQAKPPEEVGSEIVEQVAEHLVHQGYNVQVEPVRSQG